MDILQSHYYDVSIQSRVTERDQSLSNAYDKTIIIGEYGDRASPYASDGEATHPDTAGDHVRKLTWIGTMTRVPNMFWYWDEYLYANDLFGLYKPVTTYWADEDLGAQTNVAPATLSTQGGSTGGAAPDLLRYGFKSDSHGYA